MLFVYLATALAQIRIRRRIEATEPERLTLKMWLFPWLSYAVVVAIVGVLLAMGAAPALRPQLMASLASLAVASVAYLLAAKRHPHSATATGFRGPVAQQHAMAGRK
jgi:GABA permease